MTADPFQTPRAPQGPGKLTPDQAGRIDLGRAFSEGWELMKRNLGVWLGVSLVYALLLVGSVALFLIPAIVVGPALLWGYSRYQLSAYEGRGAFGDLWDGFSHLGRALAGYIPLFLASFLLSLVPQGISIAGAEMEAPVVSLVGSLLSLVVSLVTLRWMFAGLYIVEHGMNGIDAIRASWTATRGQWLTLFLFGLLAAAVSILGVLALIVGIIPAAAVITFTYVSMYRQLTGPAQV